jgi:acetaldehyde dehydrogenase
MQSYVPGFKIVVGPVFENGRIIISLTVVGAGDYLPPYAGNLDIITHAAIFAAEKIAVLRKGAKI